MQACCTFASVRFSAAQVATADAHAVLLIVFCWCAGFNTRLKYSAGVLGATHTCSVLLVCCTQVWTKISQCADFLLLAGESLCSCNAHD